jgi:hypothetical protein
LEILAPRGKLYLDLTKPRARSWIFRSHAGDRKRRDYGIGWSADYNLPRDREMATELPHQGRKALILSSGRTEKDGHKVARATAPVSLQSFFCLLTNGLVLIAELIRGCRQKPAMCG